MKTSSIDEVITKLASRPKSLKEATGPSSGSENETEHPPLAGAPSVKQQRARTEATSPAAAARPLRHWLCTTALPVVP